MPTIVRRPDRATGGIAATDNAAMEEHVQLWAQRAFRTAPIEPDNIVPALEGIYAAAGLKKPRVVIVPSPLVMAFAYGAAAAIWYQRGKRPTRTADSTMEATPAATCAATTKATYGNMGLTGWWCGTPGATRPVTREDAVAAVRTTIFNATCGATVSAGRTTILDTTRGAAVAAARTSIVAATRDATVAATRTTDFDTTRDATEAALFDASNAATGDLERAAAQACRDLAGWLGIGCARRWHSAYQAGNMWPRPDCDLTAARDIFGLGIPPQYACWEQAAIHGGFRVLHPEFVMVCDFPEVINVDAQGRPHCETGPSQRWRDGWSLYHWHGVRFPAEWIEDRASLTAKKALARPNIEQRRVACEIVGWANILRELDAKTIQRDDDPEIGELVEISIEGRRVRFLKVRCGTGREFALPVPPDMRTALQANAWTYGIDDAVKFIKPEVRT